MTEITCYHKTVKLITSTPRVVVFRCLHCKALLEVVRDGAKKKFVSASSRKRVHRRRFWGSR